MLEIVFPPSPNWYLPSVLCVAPDGCIVYGSCANFITILTPNADLSHRTFSIKIIHVAHKLRVTCIALCPGWLTTRNFASAADDGLVKLWSAETYSYAVAHNVHAEAKETVAGVAFLDERDIVSIGSLGVMVLWNSRQNSVKVDSKLLKSYKPICLSACPHRKHAVALGTKQGVVLVVSVEDSFKILFKVHGHETEVTSVCWCPSPHCEPLEKQLAMKRPKIKSLKVRKVANKKTDVTSKSGQPNEVVEDDKAFLNTSEYGLYEQSSGEEADESDIFDVYKEHSYKEFGYNPHSDSERDNANTKYTPSMLLRKNIQYQKLDKSNTSLTQAMESIKIKDEDPDKDSPHNSKFLDECKKLQDLMNSRKSIKSQGNNSFLIDDSFNFANDSVAEVVPVEPDSANVSINPADDSDIFDIYKEPSFYEFGHSKYVPSQSDGEDDHEKPKIIPAPCNIEAVNKKAHSVDFLDACKKLQDILESKKQILPGRSQDEDVAKKESDKESDKNLHRSTDEANTDDDFLDHSLRNESTVNVADESDIFDIYKEPSFYEFGHSKYIPSQSDNEAENEKPRVKISSDFLLECAKLKEMVAGKSDENSSENEISELSSNIKKLELETPSDVGVSLATKLEECFEDDGDAKTGESNIFLATCCKKGKVCIWRWGGGLVSSGTIMMADKVKDEKQKKMGHPWGALSWPSSRVLLCCSKSSQLLRCNFHACYSRSKTFGFSILHEEHNRGLFTIGASATDSADENWRNPAASPTIWTAGQDRMLVGYSADDSKVAVNYTTFGGHVYDIAVSPIAPSRFAIAAGDGMVRVWERVENGMVGGMRHYWNGVQGRVQAVAWHPTREHCLAFSNSEGRVGLLDASAMSPAKVLPPGLSLGVYNICWGPRNVLFANGGGELVVYNTSHINRDPEKLTVMSNGRKWGVSTVVWTEDFLTVGSSDGQLGLLKSDYPYDMIASGVPHRKSIQCIAWHPLAVSSEDGLSPYCDLIAISSTSPTIVIMKMTRDEAEGTVKLESYEEFNHHRLRVNKLCWSPHHNGKLLSVSHDHAVQVVDVLNKCVSHTLLGHADPVLCCMWCPVNPLSVISAGEDFTLRVWDLTNHPPQDLPDQKKLKTKKKMNLALVDGHSVKSKELGSDDTTPQSLLSVSEEQCQKKYESSEQLATLQKVQKKKSSRNQSPLAMLWKQYKDISDSGEGCRRLFKQYVARKSQGDAETAVKLDYSNGYDYLKIYGSYNDVTELLDLEQCKHEQNLNWDLWAVLGLLRGDAKNVLEKAKEKKKICSSLLSVAPSVSHRFWREMTAAYAEQLENAQDVKANDLEWRTVSWRAVLLLCSGELETACSHLCGVGLTADAVAVATLRRADHIVQKCLRLWARDNANISKFGRAAECHIVLDEIMEAATVLGRSDNEENLALAAEMAKYAASQTNSN